MSVLVCDVGVSCGGSMHVCVCWDISACRVSVKSIPVSVKKARCSTTWRLFLISLTFRAREYVVCCPGVVVLKTELRPVMAREEQA